MSAKGEEMHTETWYEIEVQVSGNEWTPTMHGEPARYFIAEKRVVRQTAKKRLAWVKKKYPNWGYRLVCVTAEREVVE